MKVIGLLSRKGGVGKTTLAVHLAVLAQQAGQRTLLIDLDPQRSAAAWWRAREAETPALVETQPAELRGILMRPGLMASIWWLWTRAQVSRRTWPT